MRFENRPVRFVNRPVRIEERPAREDRDDNDVPFANVVRPKRAHFEVRDEAFVAGKVVDEDDDDLFLENPAGQMVVVRGWHGRHRHWHWMDRDLTVPVVFQNGAFFAAGMPVVPATTVTSFIVPANDLVIPSASYPVYAYTPDSTNYAVASTLSTLLSNALGSRSNSLANSLLTNYLASYALSSLSGSPAVQTFAEPATVVSPLTYAYPTTCIYNDPNTGSSFYDPSCAPVTTTTYYTSATAFAPAQVQGVVVGRTGSTLMVLGSNGLNPVLVNDAPALQNGLAFTGQPAVGRLVTAYGFYDGNTFVATALQ